jgi:hypothetical protein
MTTLLVISLFIFIVLTPRTCFAMACNNTTVGTMQVLVWAASGTLFFTLKFLI